MSLFDCSQVDEHVDLFAAAECDEPTTVAIEQHLARCPSCTEKVETARQLLGLLDLRLREADVLRLLQKKVETESRRRRRPTAVVPLLRRFSAAAALVLVAFGLAGSLGPRLSTDQQSGPGPIASLLAPSPRLAFEHQAPDAVAAIRKEAAPPVVKQDRAAQDTVIVERMAKSAAAFREELRARLASGRLTPLEVSLRLLLFNPGPQDLTLLINERTEWQIDLQGPRVATLPTAVAAPPVLIPAQPLLLPAGKGRTLPVTRLVSVSPRGSSYTYWTAPGEYELKVSLRTEAWLGKERTRQRPVMVTVTSQPIKIKVVGPPHP